MNPRRKAGTEPAGDAAPESEDLRLQESSLSHREVEDALRKALQATAPASSPNGPSWYPYCREVYDDYIVYEGPDGKIFSRGYTVDAPTMAVTLGDPQEVVERREYVPVSEAAADDAPEPGAAGAKLKKVKVGGKVTVAVGTQESKIDRITGEVVGQYPSADGGYARIKTGDDAQVDVSYDTAREVDASEASGGHYYGSRSQMKSGSKDDKGGGAGGGITTRENGDATEVLGAPVGSKGTRPFLGEVRPGKSEGTFQAVPKSGKVATVKTKQAGIDHIVAAAGAASTSSSIMRGIPLREALEELLGDEQLEEVGKRNSLADTKRLQAAHDALIEAGAVCAPIAEAAVVEADQGAAEEDIAFRESGWDDSGALVTLQEAGAVFNDEDHTVTITPIRPGFGNKRDNFYYPAATLKESVLAGAFDNRKMYRDHPTKTEEKEQPERSTTKWFATAKTTTWDEARQVPRTTIKVYDHDAYARFKEAPDEIAFSIRGKGKARQGKVDGQSARIVEAMPIVQSIDWVTEAGAGGAIESFSESAREEIEMEFKDLTLDQIRDARPDLFKAIQESEGEATTGDGAGEPAAGDAPAAPAAPAGGDAAPGTPTSTPPTPDTSTTTGDGNGTGSDGDAGSSPGQAPAGGAPAGEPPAPNTFLGMTSMDQLVDALAPALVDRIQGVAGERAKVQESQATKRSAGKAVVQAAIQESGLPRRAKEVVLEQFAEASIDADDEKAWKDEGSLKAAVDQEIARAARIAGVAPKAGVAGMGSAPAVDPARATTARIEESLGSRWGSDEPPATKKGSRDPSGDGGVIQVDGDPADATEGTTARGAVAIHTREAGKPATLSEAGATVFDSLSDRLGAERAPTPAK